MSLVYVDTSVLGRLLMREPDTPVIVEALGSFEQRVASRLLRVELRRMGMRERLLRDVDELLSLVLLLPIAENVLAEVETLPPPTAGTLDAIHLATAVHLANDIRVDAVMTYDKQLAAGAREHGFTVLSPA